MKKLFLLYFIINNMFLLTALALDVDERLTLRIVKTSQSRKTILINRGIEDAIVKGDHAKFFLTVGVVARGVAVKVSPTRSVWSLYRLVNADYIRDDQVMRLKITPPVKITKDESKMLVLDDTTTTINNDPRNLGIPLAEGANDEDTAEIGLDGKIAKSSAMDMDEGVSLIEKNKEFFLSLHYSSTGFVATPSNDSGEASGSQTSISLDTGMELHAKNFQKWYSRFSIVGRFKISRNSASTYRGDIIEENITEFGGGINWYPTTRTSKVYRFIPYGSFGMLFGSANSTFTPSSELSSANIKAKELSGSTFGYFFGAGLKYYTPRGYGAKVTLNYHLRGDTYAADAADLSWTKNNALPVLSFGLSKRF